MKLLTRAVLFLLILSPAACLAQGWQVGAGGGYSWYWDLTATNGSGQATAGFKGGFAVSAIAAHDMYNHLGGELRYDYMHNDMKVSGNGQEATFSGESHAIHYEILWHATSSEAKVRPFVAAGGGGKYYRGTGTESAYQPLEDFVILTKTSEFKPLITAGGGVKFRIGPRVALCMEVLDFITPTPDKVLAPAPGTHLGGWLHNLVPMVAITFGL